MIDAVIYALRVPLWLLSAALLAFGTYLAWPSRWNIPAHVASGFFVVAHVVPVLMLDILDKYDSRVVTALVKVMTVGAACYLLGVMLGSSVGSRSAFLVRHDETVVRFASSAVRGRARVVLLFGILSMTVAIVVMGFVPMFAPDPMAAKYFRGAYGDAYAPVAPLYRIGTAVLTALMPVAAAYSLQRHRVGWRVLAVASLALMLITLQRGPAIAGLLLFIGVWMVARGRLHIYVVLVVGTYVAGTLFYALLGLLGVESFEGIALSGGSLVAAIGATAPDIEDAFRFYVRWMTAGSPLTLGRTFLGGIVPGNYVWNPGVWTLTLGDPAVDLRAYNSGGLRLPLPVWGLVSFGVVGVVVIPLLSGVFAGIVSRKARLLMELCKDNIQRTWVIVLVTALSAVFVNFYAVSYFYVVQLLILFWILRRMTSSTSRLGPSGTGRSRIGPNMPVTACDTDGSRARNA